MMRTYRVLKKEMKNARKVEIQAKTDTNPPTVREEGKVEVKQSENVDEINQAITSSYRIY